MSDVYDTPDWRALVAAIRAAPAADLPRLVAADWLDDRGEAGRAELIRLQCGVRDIPSSAVVEASRRVRAEANVVVEVTRAVLGHIPLHPGGVGVTRGFVERVVCPAAAWVAHGDALLAREPVTRVRLTTIPYFLSRAGEPGISVSRDPAGRWFRRDAAATAAGDPAAEGLRLGLLRLRWPGVEFELPPA